MISVIIPSYLGHYKHAASYRDRKLLRAIDSVMNQSFTDFEIIVVADGCARTVDILNNAYCDHRLETILIDKQNLWSGVPRQTGIDAAKGEYITYLDIDDYFGEQHLEIISQNLNERDWVYYDDYLMTRPYEPALRKCELKKYGCGTSNFTHKKNLGNLWDVPERYSQDFYFYKRLEKHNNFAKIQTPQYYVCHLPQKMDL